jgi:hypothetical protein
VVGDGGAPGRADGGSIDPFGHQEPTMKIRTAIANLVTVRRAAAVLVAVPSLLLFSPTAAHAAAAALPGSPLWST